MMKLSSRIKNRMRAALILALGLSLFTASLASATRCDQFKQVYAETHYNDDAHKHLDVVCKQNWRAISCEPKIGGKNDSYNHEDNRLNQEVIAINENHPVKFSDRHGYDHHGYYGCHFRANNFLSIFGKAGGGDDRYRNDHREDDRRGYFEWKLGGYATCVPNHCVDTDHARYQWESRDVYPFE